MHVNREMISLMNKAENLIEFHVNRVLKYNEKFQTIFNCPLYQHKKTKKINSLLPDLCSTCRKKKN